MVFDGSIIYHQFSLVNIFIDNYLLTKQIIGETLKDQLGGVTTRSRSLPNIKALLKRKVRKSLGKLATMISRVFASRKTEEDARSTWLEQIILPISEVKTQLKPQSLPRKLVSALYESSEEDMEVYSASVTVIEKEQDADSNIEVIACYRGLQFTHHSWQEDER